MVKDRLEATPAVLHLPIGAGGPESNKPFVGLVDLVKMKALVWHDEELGAKWDEVEIPADMVDQASGVPRAAARDDRQQRRPPDGEVPRRRGALREGGQVRDPRRHAGVRLRADPVRLGVQEQGRPADARRGHRLPAEPARHPARRTASTSRTTRSSIKADENGPFAALAFKIVADPFGKLTYFRVYSGKISKGDEVYNSTKEKRERLGRILLMHANQREDLDVAMAGDIVAGLGFKDVTTGDTLCDRQHPVILERMIFPEPVIHVAIEPKTKDDQDKLGKALKSLSDEDPTFRVRTDEETGQTVISGMGELHLEILVDRMMREFNVDATVGKPQVAYRETITKKVESVEYRHIKQSGGSGQFAVVKITLEPTPRRRLRVRGQDQRRQDPARVHPAGQPGHPERARLRRARRLPDGGRQGDPRRRPVPRRRLLARWRSRSPARWRSRRPPRWPSRCCSSRSWPSRSSPPTTSWAT